MNTEDIDLSCGYTATIAHDTDAANPFTEWGCEPPIAVLGWKRYQARLENYKGDALDLDTLLDHIPRSKWETREGKREILVTLDIAPAEILAEYRNWGTTDFRDLVLNYLDVSPDGWAEWGEYFEKMEAAARLAGIPFHSTQFNGYSQGDSALVFVAALPEWVERMGITDHDSLTDQCRAAADLWSAWAWGDVYGVQAITRPDGTEAPDGSCWEFYGADHDKSGLMEYCNTMVEHDRAYLAREAAAAHEAACRDIATVPALAYT